MAVTLRDREPLDMSRLHSGCCGLESVVLAAADNVYRHCFSHLHLIRIAVVRNAAHRDVAVGNHSDNPTVPAYRKTVNIILLE
jgi:hypothetical protein